MESQKSTVSGLPKGRGSGILLEGSKEVVVRGAVVRKIAKGKSSTVLKQFSEKEGVLGKVIRTFGGETEVKEWIQDDVCDSCPMICNGICEDPLEV